MGGGDLNLKKSWHPSTRANLEKVYLAEQEAEKEKKRLEELKREKRREKDSVDIRKIQESAGILKSHPDRLEWMYSSTYSKASDQERHRATYTTPIVQDLSTPASKASEGAKWDIESKIREDPLLRIKKSQSLKSEYHRSKR